LHLALAKVVDANRSDVRDGSIGGSSSAETERLVKGITELSSGALGVQALVECVLKLGVVAKTLLVAVAAGDELRVGPALGDTA